MKRADFSRPRQNRTDPGHNENSSKCEEAFAEPWGGGTWYICLTGMGRFLGCRFRTLFLERVSKDGNFSGAGCQIMSKREVLLDRVVIEFNFLCFEVFACHRFFPELGII